MGTLADHELLFVYGSLRRGSGHAMAYRLADEAEWLGAATAAGQLYAVADYPALVLAPDGGAVAGDLFRLSDPQTAFCWLDSYEGCGDSDPHPHDYARVVVQILSAGASFYAQCYVWNHSLDGLRPIRGGDWLAALASGNGGA